MVNSLKRELSKIIDVTNNRALKFIFKYGVLKALWVTLVLCILFSLLGSNKGSIEEILYNSLIRLGISIIPGTIWGIVDYNMYKDITNERKTYRINSILFVILNGIFGWGLICATCNVTFIPYDKYSLIAALVALPFYGVILGIVQKKFFNGKLIKQLFEENIKGKNITSVKKKDNKLVMR